MVLVRLASDSYAITIRFPVGKITPRRAGSQRPEHHKDDESSFHDDRSRNTAVPAALVAGMIMFALKWLGGGDAKLFAAVSH